MAFALHQLKHARFQIRSMSNSVILSLLKIIYYGNKTTNGLKNIQTLKILKKNCVHFIDSINII